MARSNGEQPEVVEQRVEELSSYGTSPYMFKSERISYICIFVFKSPKVGMKTGEIQ